jgi:multicomponent Na+:H+ antiporter subunit D
MFSALAFTVLMLYHIYPPELKSTNLDTEWFYRRLLPRVLNRLGGWIDRADQAIRKESLVIIGDVIAMIERNHGPESAMSRTILAGSMALVVITVLLLFLVVVII